MDLQESRKRERRPPTGSEGNRRSTAKRSSGQGEATTLSSHKFSDPVLGLSAGPPGVWWPLCSAGVTRVEETGRDWHELRDLAG